MNLERLVKRLLDKATIDGIQKIVVGAVITDAEGSALCLKRCRNEFMPGLWELPSGNKEKDESIVECLHRETEEETGLKIKEIVDYIGSFDYLSGSGKKARQFTFRVSPKAGDIKLNPKEHEGYSWLMASELDSYNISNETKGQIRSVMASLGLVGVADLEQNAYDAGIKRCVVGAVIVQNNKALVVKRASDDFMGGLDEVPSGKVDFGETLTQAVIREIKEETGLDIYNVEKLVGTFDYKSSKGENRRQFTFAVEVRDIDALKLDPKEHEGYAWASLDEVTKKRYNLSEETAAQIITVLSAKKCSAKRDSAGSASDGSMFGVPAGAVAKRRKSDLEQAASSTIGT